MKNLQYSTLLICVSVIAALLLGYWVFAVAEGTENDNVAGITSSICFLVTLIPILGISHKSAPINVNLKVLSIVFGGLMLVTHFCFAGFGIRMPYYVLVSGLLLLVYLAGYIKLADKNL